MIPFEINTQGGKSHPLRGVHSPICKFKVFEENLLLPIQATRHRL